MADFYQSMAEMASELLSPTSQGGLGQGNIVLSRTTTVAPENPWESPQTSRVRETLRGAAKGVDSRLVGVEIGGTVILASDRQVICAVPEMDYVAGDTISIDGKPVHIISVQNIPAAGVRSAVRFVVRG